MYFKEINSYGDRGLVLDFGNETSKSISQEVNETFLNILNLNLQSLNIIPSFNKIVVIFENSKIRDQNKDKISMKMKDTNSQTNKKVAKTWEIPACYNEDFALDMKIIQKLHQITKEEVINLHSSVRYYTY